MTVCLQRPTVGEYSRLCIQVTLIEMKILQLVNPHGVDGDDILPVPKHRRKDDDDSPEESGGSNISRLKGDADGPGGDQGSNSAMSPSSSSRIGERGCTCSTAAAGEPPWSGWGRHKGDADGPGGDQGSNSAMSPSSPAGLPSGAAGGRNVATLPTSACAGQSVCQVTGRTEMRISGTTGAATSINGQGGKITIGVGI